MNGVIWVLKGHADHLYGVFNTKKRAEEMANKYVRQTDSGGGGPCLSHYYTVERWPLDAMCDCHGDPIEE